MKNEDIKKYAELWLKIQRGYGNKLQMQEGYEGHDGSFIPIDLSDEDKFICTLFYVEEVERGVTTQMLTNWFGWTKYKSYKIARENQYCITASFVCEEGGYAGRGWILNYDMGKAIKKYIYENYPCTKCANFNEGNPGWYRLRDSPSGSCSCNHNVLVWEDSGCKTGYFKAK